MCSGLPCYLWVCLEMRAEWTSAFSEKAFSLSLFKAKTQKCKDTMEEHVTLVHLSPEELDTELSLGGGILVF